MKNIKKDIPAIAGLLGSASLAVITGGLIGPAATGILNSVFVAGSSIGASLAANFIGQFTPATIKRWFVGVHPDDLNHHIKRLFVKSVNEALYNIQVLFSETQATKDEQKEAKQLIKTLQKHLPDMLLDSHQIKLEESEIKHFLYEKDKEDDICNFIKKEFETFGITEPFQSFLAQNLSAQIQLCFGEGLKDPANQNAWIAFQRMLTEEIRTDIKDLKFEKAGFSEEQTAEIRQLVKILDDKKLVEVKIKDSINDSLQSIEEKANEIIRITTKTQLTVDELKYIIRKQTRVNLIVIFTSAVCLLVVSAFVGYKLMNQPFTATIQVTNWDETFFPTLELEIDGKIKPKQIDKKGIAEFNEIPSKYDNEKVSVKITDTENMPYYLSDSVIQIHKDKISEIQVRLKGLEKLQGTIFDDISGEGLPDASVMVADISAKTDEKGFFSIDIPIEKQQREQKLIISKEGYESKREIVSMTGEYNAVLKRK